MKTSPAGRLPNAPGVSSTPSSSFHSRPVTSKVQSVPPGGRDPHPLAAREPLGEARGEVVQGAVVGCHLVLEHRPVHAPAEGHAGAGLDRARVERLAECGELGVMDAVNQKQSASVSASDASRGS